MTTAGVLAPYFARLESCSGTRWQGRITQVVGSMVESEGPFCSVGEFCHLIDSRGNILPGEVVGFRGPIVLSMPLARPDGLRYGDRVVTWGARACIPVGAALLGRVIDGSGVPLDSRPPAESKEFRRLDGQAPLPLERAAIREAVGCGVRAIDAMLTCGRGQRVGIFGGSGVGKSTLIGMMARNTEADVIVLALVGERGREVREFLGGALGERGRERSVVVVSTSDQSPLLRIRAALSATAIAEYFCGQGKQVLLVVDSLTRLAMAQREISLAAGEPPTAKGYTPSVFSMLARLVERAGNFGAGSITAFYTVLMEGDDEQDPLVDGVRALLDGHIMLDRRLAARGHYPPISVLDSVSRLMPAVCSRAHMRKAQQLRQLLASYRVSEDLLRIGAYQKGSDPTLDQAIAWMPRIEQLLCQAPEESAPLAASIEQLLALLG